MAVVDFSDLDSAEAWFETQSVDVRCAMSSRAALRVFANFRTAMDGSPNDLDVALLRATLTSAGRGSGRLTDVNWEAAFSAAYPSAAAAHYAAAFSGNTATHSAAAAANSAANSAHSAAVATHSANSAAFWDSQHLNRLFSSPVWKGADVPKEIAANHSAVLRQLKADPAWYFWVRFYEGMWDGTFDDWDLAFEVIKIEEADWEKGHVHIGEVISEIARSKTAKAAAALRVADVDRFGIGGNHPPADEVLDSALVQIQQGAQLIETEVEAETPDESAVEKGLSLLNSGLKVLLVWLAKKGDLTVDQLIKWGVPAVCAHIVLNPQKVQALISAAKAWLPLI